MATVPAIIAPVFLALQQRRPLAHERNVRADDAKAHDETLAARAYGGDGPAP